VLPLPGVAKVRVLADQDRVDAGVANALLRDHTAMHVSLQDVVAAEEARQAGELEVAALLEIL